MKIIIAPNAFKHSLAAIEVAEAIKSGLVQSGVGAELITFPIGDGGDGTGALLAEALHAKRLSASVNNPIGRTVDSGFYLTDDHSTAIIEMADASGIRLLEKTELDPLSATSVGTGQLIRAALGYEVKKILLCVGGSATVDGGCGLLTALGATFLDQQGREITDLPAGLRRLGRLNLDGLYERVKDTKFVVLTDVRNPLLGEDGGVNVFSPQKGASKSDVFILNESLERLASVINGMYGTKMESMAYGGAAGGVAATLSALFNAELVNGIDYFLNVTGFDEMLPGADLVITGEGSLDRQTLEGKGPFGVAKHAKEYGLGVVAMAGKLERVEATDIFDELIDINAGYASDDALARTYERLVKAAFDLGLRLGREQLPA